MRSLGILLAGISLVGLVGCGDSDGKKREPITSAEQLIEKSFTDKINQLEDEADKNAKHYTATYRNIIKDLSSMEVDIDSENDVAVITLISDEGERCVFNPSKISEEESWTSPAESSIDDCQRRHKRGMVTVAYNLEGVLVRVKGIVLNKIELIAVVRNRDLIVSEASPAEENTESKNLAEAIKTKAVKVQAIRFIYPRSFADVQRNFLSIDSLDGEFSFNTSASFNGDAESIAMNADSKVYNLGTTEPDTFLLVFPTTSDRTAELTSADINMKSSNYISDFPKIANSMIKIKTSEDDVSLNIKLGKAEEKSESEEESGDEDDSTEEQAS